MGDELESTRGKENFQRFARLLVRGGKSLLKEVFDSHNPPSVLPLVLAPCLAARPCDFNSRERKYLEPSPGVYRTSADCDITLLFKLVRHLCNLLPPATSWDNLPNITDHSLSADLARVKSYRNKVCHDNDMELDDVNFQSMWKEISDALVRIAKSISATKEIEWQTKIGSLLVSPLTEDGKMCGEELNKWYRDDMETKAEVQQNTLQLQKNTLQQQQNTLQQQQNTLQLQQNTLQQQQNNLQMQRLIDRVDQMMLAIQVCLDRTTPSGSLEHPSQPQPAQVKIWDVILSSEDSTVLLKEYFKTQLHVPVEGFSQGSLLINVSCNSLQILEGLWKDYCSGHLNEVVQSILVTADVLKKLGLEDMKLKTFISEEEYRTCKEHFMNRLDVASTCTMDNNASNMDVKEGSQASKRTAVAFEDIAKSEGFTSKRHDSGGQKDDREDEMVFEETGIVGKRKASLASESSGNWEDAEFYADIVFATDYSSFVKEEDKQKQLEVVQGLAESLNVTPGKSRASVIAYGDTVEVLRGFDDKPLSAQTLSTGLSFHEGSRRRIDLALIQARDILNSERSLKDEQGKKIVILITTGNQGMAKESLQSASEELHQPGYQLIVVPVGVYFDFKELSVMIERPQSLFRLLSLDELLSTSSNDIKRMAMEIRKTSDVVVGTKENVKSLGINPDVGFGEKTSNCLDVMEEACYILWEQKNIKSKGAIEKAAKVEKLIQGSINDFNNILVSQSNVTISIAVFGPVGVGKSYLLNFLLNHDLSNDKACKVPLPSADGGSQTPLPVRVKYRNSVKVSLFKTKNDPKPEVWYSEELLSKTTLVHMNDLLEKKFKEFEVANRSGKIEVANIAAYIEIEGPFPIFRVLKDRKMTSCGHLELEVDIEFVDLPGLGAGGETEASKAELSNADLVLFFDCGQSGRPVTQLDLQHLFCNHNVFEYTLRPKVIHVVNYKSPTAIPPDLSLLHKKKKEELLDAWKPFFKTEKEGDNEGNADYRNAARAKLPHLGGEELLERLRDECEVLIFHPDLTTFLPSLSEVIKCHVDEVKVKRQIHPVLKSIYPVAKQLKRQTSLTATLASKETSGGRKHLEGIPSPSFELCHDMMDAEDLVESFVYEKRVLLDDDIGNIFHLLYNKFLYSLDTTSYLFDMLQLSLEHFSTKLKACLEITQTWKFTEVSNAFQVVTEMLCNSRVQKFCANSAQDYLHQVLDKGKDRNPLAKFKRDWQASDYKGRKQLCRIFLRILLKQSLRLLERPSRDIPDELSPFKFKDDLWKDVKELLAVEIDAKTRPELLKSIKENVNDIVEFCSNALSDINPHPSIKNVPLPEAPQEACDTGSVVPTKSNCHKILKEMRQRLLKAASKTDPVRELEKKLNLDSGTLACKEEVDRTLWAKLLVDVLSDDNHLQINLKPRLLDPSDTEVMRLLPQAKKCLFAYQRSQVRCKVVEDMSCPGDEIIVKKSVVGQKVFLEAAMSKQMHKTTQKISTSSRDITSQIAPVFIPVRHLGPSQEMTGNFLLQDDPWAKDMDGREQDEASAKKTVEEESQNLDVFLIVEPQHLQTCKDAVHGQQALVKSKVKINYVVLPHNGCKVGVIKAIVKVLADCLSFQLFWIIDDDVKSMYQFDENKGTWYKCSIHRGLLFGQRVFQNCQEKTLEPLTLDEQDKLFDMIDNDLEWPKEAKRTKRSASQLFSSDEKIAAVQRNPRLLNTPFSDENIAKDCKGDASLSATLNALKSTFEEKCKRYLFGNISACVGGISLGHVSTRKYDYMIKFPTSHFKRSDQGYKMVLLNSDALKWMNFVSDDMIFDDEKASDYPGKGIKNIEKSFNQALAVNGVSNFQVICFTHDHKKLASAFGKNGPFSSGC